MSAAWPNDAGFPQYFLAGVSQTNSDSVVETQMDAGVSKRRLREDGGYERFEGSIIMTLELFNSVWIPFFYETCRRLGPFTWIHPFSQASAECSFTKKGFNAKPKDSAHTLMEVNFEIEIPL